LGIVVVFNISEMGLLSPEGEGLEERDRHEHAQRLYFRYQGGRNRSL